MRVQVRTVNQLIETTVVHRRLAPYEMDILKCDSLALKSIPRKCPGSPERAV